MGLLFIHQAHARCRVFGTFEEGTDVLSVVRQRFPGRTPVVFVTP